jgi:hypothetical protein
MLEAEKTTYYKHLQSNEWRKKAQERLKKDNHQCQTCLDKEQLEVHHKTYKNLGKEKQEDLITLCKQCHEAITEVIRRKRYNNKPLETQRHETTIAPYTAIEANNGIQNTNSQDYRSSTTTNAFRINGGSIELLRQRI